MDKQPGKNPAFLFYPGDWFREPGLKLVGINVRGAWSELLYVMHDCKPRGKIESDLKGLAGLWRITTEEAAYIVDELLLKNIADVEFFDQESKEAIHCLSDAYQGFAQNDHDFPPDSNPIVTIINRRMYNEWLYKENNRLKQQRSRSKKKSNPNVPSDVTPLLSSSSSSSPSKIKKNTKKKDDPLFEKFWSTYPRKTDKDAARKSWAKLNGDLDKEMVIAAVIKQCRTIWQGKEITYIPHASTWLNRKRWEDEIGKTEDEILRQEALKWEKGE